MKKAFVTGGTGHLGAALCAELKERGFYVVSAYSTRPEKYMEDKCDEQVSCSVGNLDRLTECMAGADVVFHLAGLIWIAAGNKKRIDEINVEGTKNVVAACRAANVSVLIYASSIHAVDFRTKAEILREKTEYDPKYVKGYYGKSKAKSTNYVMKANSDSLRTVALMPTGVVGAYCYRMTNFGQMISDYSRKKIPIYLEGKYNFVDVRDIAEAFCVAAERGKGGESYLLSGENATIKQTFAVLSELSGVKQPKIKLPMWLVTALSYPMEALSRLRKKKPTFTPYSVYTLNSNCNCDNEKARRDLGFSPRSFAESLKAQYMFMKERGML